MLAALTALASLALAAPPQVCSDSIRSSARGSYFRKVASISDDTAQGLRASVSLPQVETDAKRRMTPKPGDPEWWEGPLDRPSVYLGVSAEGVEVDAGLTWDRVYDTSGRPTAEFAFRPFWRVADASGNAWHNPPMGDQFYYHARQRLKLSLKIVKDGLLRLDIEDAGRSGAPHFAAGISVEGLPLTGTPRSFKRVNALDQFVVSKDGKRKGTEGGDTVKTSASATGAVWQRADLLGPAGAARPLAGDACRVVLGRDEDTGPPAVRASMPSTAGGEVVDLRPSAAQ